MDTEQLNSLATELQNEAELPKNEDLDKTTEPQVSEQEGQEAVEESVTKIIVKSPSGAEIIMRMAPTDTLYEARQLLLECVETCYVTSFKLTLDGGKSFLVDYKEIGQFEEFQPDTVMKMVPAPYDERDARKHFERIRELLFADIDDLFISSVIVHKKPNTSVYSYPSFAGGIEGDPFSDLDLALNCDSEFNDLRGGPSALKAQHSRRKGKRNKGQARPATDMSYDSRYLFDTESKDGFSMNGISQILKSKKQKLMKCLDKLEFAAWNPPPGNRRLMGDLFYIKAKTLEEQTFYITASTSGFFVNNTKSKFNPTQNNKYRQSDTLLGLLFHISPLFAEAFKELVGMRTLKHPFDVTPVPFPNAQWINTKQPHSYDAYRAEETIAWPFGFDSRGDSRDWNEEYQSCKELPSGTVEERIVRDRTLFKIYSDFVDTAKKGAQAVVHKSLRPMNIMDPESTHVFVHKNIFFSFASDKDNEELEREKALQALHASEEDIPVEQDMFSIANNDLKGLKALNEADVRGIHTLATALIDYRGHRIVAQSIIPGILHGEQGSTHAYGSIDSGKVIKSDTEFHELMKQIGQKLRLKEHQVKDAEGKEYSLCAPLETKGIIGSDGRKYILDLVRITPRDLNFADNTTAILRPELVKDFLTHKVAEGVVQLRAEEQKQKGDQPNATNEKPASEDNQESKESKDDSGIQSQDIEKYISQLDAISFNPNLGAKVSLGGSEDALNKDQQLLQEASEYLVKRSIPALVNAVYMLEALPMDGMSLTDVFHERGINMRYLGKVAEQAEKVPFFKTLCEQEMVVRTAKRYFNALLRKTPEQHLLKITERFLNSMFGDMKPSRDQELPDLSTSQIHARIREMVKTKFGYTLSKTFLKKMNKMSTLRNFCLRVGLCIVARDYEFTHHRPFNGDDILDIHPVVKHAAPMSSTAMRHYETGKANLSTSQLESAYHFLYEALMLFQQIHGPMNRESATCYSNLASLMSNVSDVRQAILHQHKALLISRRVMGEDHPLTAQFYQLMGMHAHSVNQTELALRYFLRAKYIAQLIYGTEHPEYAIYLTNIATMYQDMGDSQRAIKYLTEALSINQKILGDNHFQTSSTYHSLAVTYSAKDNFKKAVEYERKSANILRSVFGSDDIRTQDSQKWLSYFTSRAVESRKEVKSMENTAQALLQSMPKQFQTAFKSMYNSDLENVDMKKMAELVEHASKLQQREKNQSVAASSSSKPKKIQKRK